MKIIRAVIVDDSALVQKMLSKILNDSPNIIVVGVAENPNIARKLIKSLNPDVILLDIEMPEMDGLTFLEKLMRLNPIPVVMCSSFTPHSREMTLEALELGAIDIIAKPIRNDMHEEIRNKVINAAQAKVQSLEKISESTKLSMPMVSQIKKPTEPMIYAIGASTGGTEALTYLFQILPNNLSPIVVSQHLPEGFAHLFAARTNKMSALTIKVAEEGEMLKNGHVYIAPGGKHLEIEKKHKDLYVKLNDNKALGGHMPSADVMMHSLASIMGKRTVGILLTGMGADGAQGMLEIQRAGGITAVQDEATSVVWGMPRAAIDLGAAKFILPLQKIPEMMINSINKLSI